jgi:orotidine-5'-phosphate decarboxylase
MRQKIIVAVDGLKLEHAKEKGLLTALSKARDRGMVWGVKINDMLFSGDPAKIITSLREDYKLGVMADVKFHDIPSTMENGINNLVNAGANIITVHCSSNFRPKNIELLKHLAGVTTLTSFTDLEIKWIYDKSSENIVKDFSDIALMNHYEYLYCSVKDLHYIHDNPLLKICTGIRPSWYQDRHDQVKIASVKEAARMEADYIVIGRPITQAKNVMEALEKVYEEIM